MDTPLTRAERTNYKETSLYQDVIDFLSIIAKYDNARIEYFGKSHAGRHMPLLILNSTNAFTPEEARKQGLPVVLIINNIHAGEVEGKEASLIIAREYLKSNSPILSKMVILIVPLFNPDGNDALSKENRKLDLHTLEGQPDPELVGTRSTVGGYNLNRDYMKAEAVEMINLNKNVYYKWLPELTVDCHTTNGSKHGYELTYGTAMNPASPPEPMEYVRTKMLPEITTRLFKRTGFRTFFYGNFADEKDPSKGWKTYSHLPRYGSNYRGLTGRMDILSEAYSYITFEERVKVNKEFLLEIFNYVQENSKVIIETVKSKPLMSEVPIKAELAVYDEDYELLARDIDEKTLKRLELKTYKTKFWGKFKPTQTVKRPKAYIIPKSMTKVIDKLKTHNIKLTELAKDQELDVTSFTVTDIKTVESADHGSLKREEHKVTVEKKKSKKKFTKGDYIVQADQPLGNLVVYLLEPESDDGLATWGYYEASAGKELNVYRLE